MVYPCLDCAVGVTGLQAALGWAGLDENTSVFKSSQTGKMKTFFFTEISTF